MPPGDWSPEPKPAEPTQAVHDGSDPDCDDCAATDRVAAAGARILCAHVGIDFNAIEDPHVQAHYKVIVADVMGAMSEALLAEKILVESVSHDD